MIGYIIVFILGAVIGSFLNVCIYRLPRDISIIMPSSMCPSCGRPIRFYDNIPIISYILLKGRCRECGSRISIRYPLVEALNALLFVSVLHRFGSESPLLLVIYLFFVSSLIVITFIDLEFQIIPDRITIPWIPISLVFGATILPDPFFRHDLLGFKSSLIGMLSGGGLFYMIAIVGKAIFRKDAMGGGDIKLMAVVGGMLGYKGVILTTFIGSLAGSIVGMMVIFYNRQRWGVRIPFGPFLALGALVSLLSGQEILHWYLSRPYV
jgi:leader peptidase (prepilin peptidase)/N-methyltransferase